MKLNTILSGTWQAIRVAFWLLSLMVLAPQAAHAQATRTWVSGVGDDVNPCSRTAPCKTFAGAIAKTAAGGEVDVLDPGGFGTLTITKSITIDGGAGQVSNILASATNGINVNAGTSDIVILRNLTINGAGTTLGITGINFLAGKSLHVQNVKIERFSSHCIAIQPNNVAGLPGSATVTVEILDSTFSNCQTTGLFVNAPSSSTPVNVSVEKSRLVLNGTGVTSNSAWSTVQMSNATVFGNTTGLSTSNGGVINSFGNNQTVGNTTNGSFSGTAGTN
jgi:hypothetical protein